MTHIKQCQHAAFFLIFFFGCSYLATCICSVRIYRSSNNTLEICTKNNIFSSVTSAGCVGILLLTIERNQINVASKTKSWLMGRI